MDFRCGYVLSETQSGRCLNIEIKRLSSAKISTFSLTGRYFFVIIENTFLGENVLNRRGSQEGHNE